ncbi:polymer-forming cytoskeletal protein [Clostridium isatidis]|uniref:Cell shape determination protein CcmA n=1 Tax=Clostridium isatidis TaxID=182773 RepID=A0A343JCD2_9CLOT|nr:polymer-forming cytoskeletal protein [Clostridium isatidis]ASW43190.1 hypothetical protein BEN51_06760 [Clostridium isatidis]NLZ33721.1 polymer-forming cytoskeletal protein [Clostridiales bacterium]
MKNKLNINGIGDIVAGEYANIEISGIANMQGDIRADSIEVDGKVKAFGNVKADEIEINGHVTSEGKIEANFLDISGYFKGIDNASGEKLKVNGRIKSKNISFKDISLVGEMFVENNCEAEDFYAEGKINIKGLLSADNIEIILQRRSNITEIGGEKLSVRKEDKGIFSNLFFNSRYILIVEEIEADEIYLEYTKCKVVRGNNINIGEGCNIEKIEYKNKLEINEKSIVKENYKK